MGDQMIPFSLDFSQRRFPKLQRARSKTQRFRMTCMLSLDSLEKVAKGLDFPLDILLSEKSSQKLSRLAGALHILGRQNMGKLSTFYVDDYLMGDTESCLAI